MFHVISIPRYIVSRIQWEMQYGADHTIATAHAQMQRELFRWWAISAFLLCVAVWASTKPAVIYQPPLYLVPAFVCVCVNFIASVIYLARRNQEADALARASARVAVICYSATLVSATASTHKQLNIWWNWNAGGTISLFLVVIYAGYLLLRKLYDPGRVQLIASVFAIFAFADVPFVSVSVPLRLADSGTLPRFSAGGFIESFCRPPHCWSALLLLGLAILAVVAQYRVVSIRQLMEEKALEQDP